MVLLTKVKKKIVRTPYYYLVVISLVMKKVFLHTPEKFLVGYSDNLRDFFTRYYFQYASNINHHNDNKITFYDQKYCAEMVLTSETIQNNETCFMKFI